MTTGHKVTGTRAKAGRILDLEYLRPGSSALVQFVSKMKTDEMRDQII
jgi:hypothetical protein